jgi:hypothetical protein
MRVHVLPRGNFASIDGDECHLLLGTSVIHYSDDGANNNHNNILVSCNPDKVHFLLFQL